jgi:drug/metabolite transporter (DMT)-like permease
MKRSDLVDLLALAALWGASFLFMRVAAPQFGALPLAGLRVAGAALVLLALLGWRGELGLLRRHARPLFAVGLTNSALPFALFGYAALHLSAGLASIFNAAAPLFGALIAWAWLRDRLTPWRVAGLGLGFAGVAGLAWSKLGAVHGGPAWAVAACLTAPMLYGFSASFTKRHLAGVPALAQATGSQVFAAVVLAVPTAWAWPDVLPGAQAWLMLAVLAVACTGLAYVLYFRLIRNVGPARAITVTFLIPAFALLWGGVFLDETVTWPMLVGCAVILAGTALATGLLPRAATPAR